MAPRADTNTIVTYTYGDKQILNINLSDR